MAVTIQSDPSLAGYNCFCSLAEATAYHEARLHNDAWVNASVTEKSSALVWATKQLDTLTWRGARTSGTQLLSFPRIGLSYTELAESGQYPYYGLYASYSTYIFIDSTYPPTEIKDATAELALWLLDSDTTAPTGTEGYKRLKVDTIDIETLSKDRPDWLNDAVRNLCKRFLLNSSNYSSPTQRVG